MRWGFYGGDEMLPDTRHRSRPHALILIDPPSPGILRSHQIVARKALTRRDGGGA